MLGLDPSIHAVTLKPSAAAPSRQIPWIKMPRSHSQPVGPIHRPPIYKTFYSPPQPLPHNPSIALVGTGSGPGSGRAAVTSRHGFGSHVSEGVRKAGVSPWSKTNAPSVKGGEPRVQTLCSNPSGRRDRPTVATSTGRVVYGSHVLFSNSDAFRRPPVFPNLSLSKGSPQWPDAKAGVATEKHMPNPLTGLLRKPPLPLKKGRGKAETLPLFPLPRLRGEVAAKRTVRGPGDSTMMNAVHNFITYFKAVAAERRNANYIPSSNNRITLEDIHDERLRLDAAGFVKAARRREMPTLLNTRPRDRPGTAAARRARTLPSGQASAPQDAQDRRSRRHAA